MWTSTRKRSRGSGQCVEEAKRERDFAKESNESKKAQLVSQENASDVQTTNEAKSMIN